MNSRDVLKINRTVFNAVLAPLTVAAVLGLAGWGWWLHAGHAEQENHLTKHDGEIATLQRDCCCASLYDVYIWQGTIL